MLRLVLNHYPFNVAVAKQHTHALTDLKCHFKRYSSLFIVGINKTTYKIKLMRPRVSNLPFHNGDIPHMGATVWPSPVLIGWPGDRLLGEKKK
jgi:hypothetical protein